MRSCWPLLATAVWLAVAAGPARAADAAFAAWLAQTWPEARALGVARATFEAATRGLEPDYSLPDLVIPGRKPQAARGQAEFVRTPADYLSDIQLGRLAAQGRKLYDQHRTTLARIEREFGVPGPVVLAIWGRETAFGTYRLPHDGVRVLATQAYVGRRKDQFRQEFLLALKMLQEGHASRADLRSSWAGAMGMTQFLPSEFYKQAVDFDGDGRRDIWRSVPDALASAAKQLADKGWQRGQRWAYEVRVPNGIDCTTADPAHKRQLGDWVKRGFAPAFDRRIGRDDAGVDAHLLQPAGPYGPGFLVLPNYYVVKSYNFSDLYVLFVGQLADRIGEGRAFETAWSKVVQLATADLEAMQKHLAGRGLYRDKIDGMAGMQTRLALGAYQKANGLRLDCWPSAEVLGHMRGRAN